MPTPHRWRVAKAERFLGDAEEALRAEMWETCVSRCYYVAYHAVAALLESRGDYAQQRWRHERLAASFEARFTRRGFLFTKRDEDVFRRLLRERYAADYGNVQFTGIRARRVLEAARQLCNRLLEVISSG